MEWQPIETAPKAPRNINHESMQIFCAALQGLIASEHFHGSLYQGSPIAAVKFARSVVRAAWNDNPKGHGPIIT